jgi:hypothetical protein
MKKKIQLHRETLRSLETGLVKMAVGGVSAGEPATQCPLASCSYCHTVCPSCIC